MDACTGQILATELTNNDVDDGLQVGLLLNRSQARLPRSPATVRRIRKALRPRRRAPSRGGRYRAAALERSVERNRETASTQRDRHMPSITEHAEWLGRRHPAIMIVREPKRRCRASSG